MNILFNVNFWGERYAGFFLNYSLPSQLAPDNIPYIVRHNSGMMKYRIYTTREDAVTVESAPVFAKLRELIETEIVLLEEFDIYNRHKRGTMTLCHADAVAYANAHGFSLFFTWPDIIFSNNSMSSLYKLALAGHTTVFVGSLAVQTERFLDTLTHSSQNGGCCLSIAPRDLVAMGVKNLCQQSECWTWDSPMFDERPSWLFWKAPDSGLLQRAFHLTPMLLTPENRDIPLHYDPKDELGIDGSTYLAEALQDISLAHVIEDSDEFCFVSLNNEVLPTKRKRATVADVALHALQVFLPYHLGFFRHKIRFHTADLNPEWNQLEAQTDLIADAFYDLLDLLRTHPLLAQELNACGNNGDSSFVLDELQKKLQLSALELFNIGREFSFKGSFKDAERVFLKLLEIDPFYIEPNLELARVYGVTGEYSKGFEHLLKILQRDPQNEDARLLAQSLLNRGSAKQTADFTRSIEVHGLALRKILGFE